MVLGLVRRVCRRGSSTVLLQPWAMKLHSQTSTQRQRQQWGRSISRLSDVTRPPWASARRQLNTPAVGNAGATGHTDLAQLSSLDAFSRYVAEPGRVAIVGAPLADGQPLLGVDQGPTAMRKRGLVERLTRDDWIVEDHGDLAFTQVKQEADTDAEVGTAKRSQLVGDANKMIFEAVCRHSMDNKLVLTLGGDHSIGIGSVAGTLKAKPQTAVLWVDAHADINTPATSLSGHVHGMVLSFLLGLGDARKMPGFGWLDERQVPWLLPQRLAYVGLRDLDPGEKQFIRSLGIKAFTMHEVDKYGIGKVMEMVFDHLLDRTERPIHLSFDIDAVDPVFAPSTGTRVAGGLSNREAYYLCEAVALTGCLASMDLVEVNPALTRAGEGSEATVDMAVGLISSALGNNII